MSDFYALLHETKLFDVEDIEMRRTTNALLNVQNANCLY